ncbi:hypothetical protein L228DRAFT_53316 [Xylona heveae TC161]|uniref:Uncharacterized protein n=1 Tax=Xylona heveae (strain CBS 132557 / TC161) TaxID=1328760 RepID=A0A164ZG83_XYLHT|nr:hypothetical protein L228DRAFT_53316 [Xylona heveae TC161]KZF19064.1 hypothetical protein L228DRAFT_53316 [Xylona heveae TC161]
MCRDYNKYLSFYHAYASYCKYTLLDLAICLNNIDLNVLLILVTIILIVVVGLGFLRRDSKPLTVEKGAFNIIPLTGCFIIWEEKGLRDIVLCSPRYRYRQRIWDRLPYSRLYR